jgi:hypothetical protein
MRVRVDIYDEVEDTEPSRTFEIDALDENDAVEQIREQMRPHEKRGDAESFVLGKSKLDGPDKLS